MCLCVGCSHKSPELQEPSVKQHEGRVCGDLKEIRTLLQSGSCNSEETSAVKTTASFHSQEP